MCSLEEALEKILAAVVPLPAGTVALAGASGRFAAATGFIAGEFAARRQFLRGRLRRARR